MSALRFVLLLALLTAACAPAARPDSAGILQLAEQAYVAGDFVEAAAQLESARAAGIGNPAAVELAWGLAALQSEKPMTALIHLRRAEVLQARGGGQGSLERGIQGCELALDLRPGASQAPGDSPARAWGLLVIAVLIQASAGFARTRRRTRAAILVVGVALGVYAAVEISHPDPPALLAQSGQRLCSEPHRATAFGPALRPGTGLRIQASSDRWCLVLVGEEIGWLLTESVAGLAESTATRR